MNACARGIRTDACEQEWKWSCHRFPHAGSGLLPLIKRRLKEGKGWRKSVSEGKRRTHTLATVARRCRSAGEGSPRVWWREGELCCMSKLFPLPDKQRLAPMCSCFCDQERADSSALSCVVHKVEQSWEKPFFLIMLLELSNICFTPSALASSTQIMSSASPKLSFPSLKGCVDAVLEVKRLLVAWWCLLDFFFNS